MPPFFYSKSEKERQVMKPEKLKQLKQDVDFIDPVTMQKVCSFNLCIDKFTEVGVEGLVTYPKWKNGAEHVRLNHFHSCSECGRKHVSKGDKKKNIESALASAAGQES